ncbi:hypothetical protein DFJ74DRAFT_408117 [Hyaloraphidium curvatum]|nr:hypothetical protein DFJ74DRAFT_408117 [Hyaloraphidium curvatum]
MRMMSSASCSLWLTESGRAGDEWRRSTRRSPQSDCPTMRPISARNPTSDYVEPTSSTSSSSRPTFPNPCTSSPTFSMATHVPSTSTRVAGSVLAFAIASPPFPCSAAFLTNRLEGSGTPSSSPVRSTSTAPLSAVPKPLRNPASCPNPSLSPSYPCPAAAFAAPPTTRCSSISSTALTTPGAPDASRATTPASPSAAIPSSLPPSPAARTASASAGSSGTSASAPGAKHTARNLSAALVATAGNPSAPAAVPAAPATPCASSSPSLSARYPQASSALCTARWASCPILPSARTAASIPAHASETIASASAAAREVSGATGSDSAQCPRTQAPHSKVRQAEGSPAAMPARPARRAARADGRRYEVE